MSKRQKREAPVVEVTNCFRTKTGAENDRIIVDEIFRTLYGEFRFDATSRRLVDISLHGWCEARNRFERVTDDVSKSRILMKSLSKLDALEKLHLKFEGICKMEFIQPRERSLENLKELVVHSHRHNTVDVEIWRLPNLETLSLSCVSMKPLPKNSLPKLKTLKLSRIGTPLSAIGNLNTLQSLDVEGIFFLGVQRQHKYRHLLNSLESLTNLEYLKIRDIDGEFLYDTICGLCCLPMLKDLDISDITEMTAIPDEIGNLKSLKKLHLSGSYSEDTPGLVLPSSIRKLTLLEVLDISGAIKIDVFPSAIGDLINLKRIRFPFLTDLPDEFGKLTKLQFIDLDDGYFAWRSANMELSANTRLSKIQKLTKNMRDLRALHLPYRVCWGRSSHHKILQQKILQIANQCPFLGCLGESFHFADASVMGTIFRNQARAHIPRAAPTKLLSCALIYIKKYFSGHLESFMTKESEVIYHLLNDVIGIHEILLERE